MKIDFEECLDFVRHKLKINLFPYQEVMLKAFCNGLDVRTARCVGRTTVANAFGQYVAYLYGRNNYNVEPDIVFPYQCGVKHGLLTDAMIAHAQAVLRQEQFAREYLCVGGVGE